MKPTRKQALSDALLALFLWTVVIAATFIGGCGVARGQEYRDPSLAKHAVVRVSIPLGIDARTRKPHFTGGSATVIHTEQGRTLLLSAAHVFSGQAAGKQILLSVPTQWPSADPKVGVRVVALDQQNDLALLEYPYGPLPYVCPVASAVSTQRALSVGYDEAEEPATMRPATIISAGNGDEMTRTRERPFHGRSGGGLIDESSGTLIGVVSGYSGPRSPTGKKAQFVEVYPGANGIYASHGAITRFLAAHGQGQAAPYQPPRPQPWAQPRPFAQPRALPGGT